MFSKQKEHLENDLITCGPTAHQSPREYAQTYAVGIFMSHNDPGNLACNIENDIMKLGTRPKSRKHEEPARMVPETRYKYYTAGHVRRASVETLEDPSRIKQRSTTDRRECNKNRPSGSLRSSTSSGLTQRMEASVDCVPTVAIGAVGDKSKSAIGDMCRCGTLNLNCTNMWDESGARGANEVFLRVTQGIHSGTSAMHSWMGEQNNGRST